MLKFRELPKGEKPRERLIAYGVDTLSNEELLMIILGSGTRSYSVKEIANKLLTSYGDIRNFKDISINNLKKVDGIGAVKATLLVAILEFAKRIYRDTNEFDLVSCINPQNIIKYFNNIFLDKKQEEFYVLYLDNKKNYIDRKKLFVGSINISIVHPREVFKNAYLLSSLNHPNTYYY